MRPIRRAAHRPAGLALAAAFLLPLLAPGAALAEGFPPGQGLYHDYDEMVDVLQTAEADYPDIVDLFSIGQSSQGREIWAVKVSDEVATDEDEPEVLFDSLTHGREHLTLEQNLGILRWLTEGYGSVDRITDIVDSREIFLVPSVNPDGAEYDLTGDPYREWRKNRQPNPGSAARGTDINRNYGYRWGCCNGSSGDPASLTYRGPEPFSAPETRAMRDFMLGRRVDGEQQIQVAITFHAAGEQILWPYGYTKADVPPDMTTDDRRALRAMGRAMATRNGYQPMQSSSLYVTDGDEIDWAYGSQRIWMYTFELYPSAAKVSSTQRFYPDDSKIEKQVERNRDAILYLIERAGCRYSVIDKARTHCGPLFDDAETARGWQVDPLDTDTATDGAWVRANPAGTRYQSESVVSGSRAFVTGTGGGSAGSDDVDGGVTTLRSRAVALPATTGSLEFRYYLAHGRSATSSDAFRAWVEREDGSRTLVREELATGPRDLPSWRTVSVSMAPWAGESVRIVFEAVDGGSGSIVEAAVDDVRITRP